MIPAHARLLLTTDSARVRTFGDEAAEGPQGSQTNLNTSAYERYFDKPEVIRAYREQQLIQTPEFTLLSEGEAVGGRFRPRGLEDVRAVPTRFSVTFTFPSPPSLSFSFTFLFWVSPNARRPQEGIDTSDAAYEKRHRKYEAFEKRQRLREKEKLKHEHYKLKERIEQLRALEPSSFLGAPESFFASSRRPKSRRGEPEAQGDTHAPEPSHHNEGEWRKRQMLDVADSLDARYRTLLDTAPTRAPDLPTPTPPPQPPPSTSAPTPTTPQVPTPTYTPNAVTRRSPAPTNILVLRHPQHTQLPPRADVIELDSDGEEKALQLIKIESVSAPAQPTVAQSDPTESLKLRIRFPNRRPPLSTSPRVDQRPPSPSSPKAVAALAASSPKPSASPSPTRPRPKPIFKNPTAPPGPYVRVPFPKRVTPQDVADSPSPLSSTTSSLHAAAPSPSNSAAHPTLRRRPNRAAAHGKSGSPAATISLPVSGPPHVHVDGSSRPHKRPRVELYDEEEEELDTDDEEMAREIAEEEEDEGDEDEAGGDGRGQRGRESRRERWRVCALYREAQRHVGAPSARKTHRHLGIFGLKGFPTEVEHLRDFVPPRWALPHDDPRVVQRADELERERERAAGRRDGMVSRGAERVRGGATGGGGGGGAMGGGEGGGGGDGAGAGVWQTRLRDSVAEAVTEEGEEEECRRSDQMVLIETASAVDSQATEVMI